MPNEQNLIQNSKRTPKERRRNAQKAGKASGEARRRRKTLRENMELLLGLPVSLPEDFNILAELGVDPADTDNAMLLTAGLFKKAKGGDVAAYKEIRELIGESGGSADEQDTGVALLPEVRGTPSPSAPPTPPPLGGGLRET